MYLCLRQVMRNMQNSEFLRRVQGLQFTAQPGRRTPIQSAQRFIQKKNARFGNQRSSNGHALLFSSTERVRIAMQQVLDAKQLRNFIYPAPGMFAIARLVTQSECEIASHIQVREQQVVLVNHADAPLFRRQPRYFFLADENPPRIGMVNSEQKLEQQRLARARWSHDDQILALAHLQRDIPNREFRPNPAYSLEFDQNSARLTVATALRLINIARATSSSSAERGLV